MLASLVDAVAQSSLAMWMAENLNAFAWAESVHVLAIATVFGSILMVDLRLLGLASKNVSAEILTRGLLPFTWAGFIIAIVTGVMMFVTNPGGYVANGPFLFKMAMLALGGINMMAFHLLGYRQVVAAGNSDQLTTSYARFAGGLSIAIWLAVIAAGRLIGFTINAF